VEGIFLAAVLALTLGGFCLGSFLYHLLRGRGAFARQTLRRFGPAKGRIV